MPSQQLPQVNSESIYTEFQEHLGDEFNERILFSAPFGAGKSTFLKNFFDQHKEYITLKLYPVNYSIAPNQDVFELIKYDLLYELLSHYPDEIQLQKDEFSTLLISQMFVLHKMKADLPIKLLLKAASFFTGSKVVNEETVTSITDVFKAFSDYKAEIGETEYDLLHKYIKSFKSKQGHAYESDSISELIIEMLNRVKSVKLESSSGQSNKTVLLIDDLDRLDPEHVFRLFNVFSAHYDEVTETNKFGFDKIIFVCDVNNIQQMFNHRYGLNVEFGGYIDKFYSSEIFYFNVVKYLKESLGKIINSRYNLKKFFPDGIQRNFEERFNLHSNQDFYNVLQYILYRMIESHSLRLRNFQRFKGFAIPNQMFLTNAGDMKVYYYHLLVLLINLEGFFARPHDLMIAFENLYKGFISNYESNTDSRYVDKNIERIIEYSLPFIIDEKKIFMRSYDFEENKDFILNYVNEKNDPIDITYQLTFSHDYEYVTVKLIKCTLLGQNSAALRPNPFWFLYNAYKNCRDKKYLN